MDGFRLRPTPMQATDAELSGLFRMIEDSSTPSVVDGNGGGLASECASSPPELRGAFDRMARAVAGVLNR